MAYSLCLTCALLAAPTRAQTPIAARPPTCAAVQHELMKMAARASRSTFTDGIVGMKPEHPLYHLQVYTECWK